jgi:ATP-binding cassette subfamily C (CFTR/MRP) protein 5
MRVEAEFNEDFDERKNEDMSIKRFQTSTVNTLTDIQVQTRTKKGSFNQEDEYVRLRNLSLKVSAEKSEKLAKAGQLTKKESKKKGFTGIKTFARYFSNFNWCLAFMTILLYCIYAGLRVFSDFWLGFWAENKFNYRDTSFYPEVYVYIALTLFGALILRAFVISKGSQTAGYNLNVLLMGGLFKRPLSFFDTTPVGVILNRATKDMGDMDIAMPNMIQHVTFNLVTIFSIFVVIAIGNPIIIVFLVAIMIWYFVSSKDYLRFTVDLKRVMQITNSPLISVIAESVRGNISLRAYQREKYQSYKYDLCSEAAVSAKTHL